MLSTVIAAAWAAGAGAGEWKAGEWKEQEIDPKLLTDFTAFTVGRNRWRLGLVRQEYGLLTNVSIGTSTLPWVLVIPNGYAKVTAIQTPKFDASLEGAIYYKDFGGFGLEGVTATVTPLEWTGSWTPHRRWGIHFGHAWTLASIDGQVDAEQIGAVLDDVLGADVSKDLLQSAEVEGGLYGGANLNLVRLNLAVDYRMNRRDSLIFRYNQYLALTGLLAAGAEVQGDGDVEAQVGASARVRIPLTETLQAMASLSWQWSWRRFHLRVGVPLPLGNVYAWPQAFNLYWELGREKPAAGAP